MDDNVYVIIIIGTLALWTIVHKILNNRRTVVRSTLHGTVTYTIKGYSGPEAHRIAMSLQSLDAPADTSLVDQAFAPRPSQITKATAKDVR